LKNLENTNLLARLVTMVFFATHKSLAPFAVQSVKTRRFAASLQSFTVVFHILFHWTVEKRLEL